LRVKIVVLVKRVPDTASVFKIAGDNKSIDTTGLKFVMSPYDEYAVEAAIQLKEAGKAEEVIVMTLGAAESAEVMRVALAMGADSGVLVSGPGTENLSGKGAAEVLAAAIRPLGASLILAGKQAVDDDSAQVPERIAELLELPHASVVSQMTLDGGTVVVDREIEGGKYTLSLPLPAVVTIEKGINTPRYPTLPNIMKAKKKPIDEKNIAGLGLDAAALAPSVAVASMSLPRQDRLTKVLDGDTATRVQALVKALKEDEKVL
jgi:electron transfer flavoprotein beta subunit